MKKFAFLIHPRDISDVKRPLPITKFVPDLFLENIIQRLPKRFDIYPWTEFDVFGKAKGYIIIVFLTGQQMIALPRKYVQERILEAVLYAQDKLGVSLVGLGAYTAPLTDGGKWLVRQKNVNVNITHGDSFSAAIAAQGVEKIIRETNADPSKLKVALVGAYGLIGRALTKILLKHNFKSFLLIGRNQIKLEKLRNEISDNESIKLSTSISDVSDSDLIITSTSYPGALLTPNNLKKNAIIYDIAQPTNVSLEVCKARRDIIRIDGCYAKIPGIDLKVDMGPPKGTTFSCLAETTMQALEGDKGNYVDDIDLSHVEKTVQWQKKYGFEHADFTNYCDKVVLRNNY